MLAMHIDIVDATFLVLDRLYLVKIEMACLKTVSYPSVPVFHTYSMHSHAESFLFSLL